jgi:hypothetical protein
MSDFSKYPDELKYFGINWSQPLANQNNDTIKGNASVTAVTPAGAAPLIIPTGNVSFTSQFTYQQIGGGSIGYEYATYWIAPTNGGNVLATCKTLMIKGIPDS